MTAAEFLVPFKITTAPELCCSVFAPSELEAEVVGETLPIVASVLLAEDAKLEPGFVLVDVAPRPDAADAPMATDEPGPLRPDADEVFETTFGAGSVVAAVAGFFGTLSRDSSKGFQS